MAKSKKSSSMPLYLSVAILVLVVLGIILFLFLNATVLNTGDLGDYIEGLSDSGFTGMQVVFGYTESTEGVIEFSMEILGFSFVALLPLVFAFVGVILNITKSKLISLIGVLFLVAGAIMMLFTSNYLVWGELFASVAELLEFNAGIGSYLGLACFGLAALVGLYRTIFTIK